MPIALLNFPTDLLGDVFKQCNPFDLYCFSKCSKRARSCVKLGNTKSWKIKNHSMLYIAVCGINPNYKFEQTTDPKDYFMRKSLSDSEEVMFIETGEISELFAYLLDTFGIRKVETLMFCAYDSDDFVTISRAMIDRNVEIEELLFSHVDGEGAEDLMSLTNQMNITNKLLCWHPFPLHFQHQMTQFPKDIEFRTSHWLTIDQLLNCTCVRIELYKSMLSNQELDQFLRKWKTADGFPNLQYLEIESEKIDDKSPILDMIPPIRARLPGVDGVRIMKEDGREGLLSVDFGNSPTLKLVISDPSNE
ncbi:hypothetical protein B9Z55_003695 [Caenorhabditis nigoni]|uniref:F-box domain-containing protein n=1 Tax=Caenorhabditis nigoni TaxID=1611254 RepID=A0A2G5VRQ9_9PELO|nr:hypothetical protein B9Z55_003695 [Caenorhabditis nigoni]